MLIWTSGTRGKRCIEDRRRNCIWFPPVIVFSPRSSAVAKCQLDIGPLSLACTQAHTQNHRYTTPDIHSNYNLKSLWKISKEHRGKRLCDSPASRRPEVKLLCNILTIQDSGHCQQVKTHSLRFCQHNGFMISSVRSVQI